MKTEDKIVYVVLAVGLFLVLPIIVYTVNHSKKAQTRHADVPENAEAQSPIQVANTVSDTKTPDKPKPPTTAATTTVPKIATTPSESADKPVPKSIQGVFAVTLVDRADVKPCVAVFESNGHITEIAFANPATVTLSDASYRFGRKLNDQSYEFWIDGDAGIFQPMDEASDGRTKGFTVKSGFQLSEFRAGTKAEFEELVKGVTGKMDFRKNKEKDWKVLDAENSK